MDKISLAKTPKEIFKDMDIKYNPSPAEYYKHQISDMPASLATIINDMQQQLKEVVEKFEVKIKSQKTSPSLGR